MKLLEEDLSDPLLTAPHLAAFQLHSHDRHKAPTPCTFLFSPRSKGRSCLLFIPSSGSHAKRKHKHSNLIIYPNSKWLSQPQKAAPFWEVFDYFLARWFSPLQFTIESSHDVCTVISLYRDTPSHPGCSKRLENNK